MIQELRFFILKKEKMDSRGERNNRQLPVKVYLLSFMFLLITMLISTSLYSADLTLQINADNNDIVEDSNGSFYLSGGSDAGFGNDYWTSGTKEVSQNYSSFYRWITRDIKQGDIINSAVLTLYLKKNSHNDSENISTKFLGIDEDNTSIFSSTQK